VGEGNGGAHRQTVRLSHKLHKPKTLAGITDRQHGDLISFFLYFQSKKIRLKGIYSASHSRVAPENVGLQKEQKCNTFVCHICNEVRLCVL
jgi:hypothetical protein